MANKDMYNKLFNAYSPLKSENKLYNEYISITDQTPRTNNIRKLYSDVIANNYINESIVKGSFLKNKSFKISPKLNTTIFELNSNNSRVDLAIINGNSEVYEIKTEYDSLIRLNNQLKDYYLLYDYINIIIPEGLFESEIKNLPNDLGIITYYPSRFKNIVFKQIRKAELNQNTDPLIQLNSISKNELLKIINSNNWKLAKNDIIKIIIKKYSNNEINNIFKSYLKNKYNNNWLFLFNNYQNIQLIDYQWFFKNNLSYKIVYK